MRRWEYFRGQIESAEALQGADGVNRQEWTPVNRFLALAESGR
jgi:hypothetical protein